MPTVPRYDRDPVAPRPLQTPDAQPESFGGGAIARGLGQAGDVFAQMRDEEDRLLEDAADVELAGTADNLFRQYSQLTGDAAIKGSGDVFEAFGREADRVMASLRPAQRERFQNRYARRQQELERAVSSHADKESAAFAESTFKARVNMAGNAITTAVTTAVPEDLPVLVNDQIDEIRAAYRERAMSLRSPWRTQDEAQAAEADAVSKARRMQLEALYAADRIDEANALLANDSIRAEFVGGDLALAQEGQKRATEQHKVNVAYTEAMAIEDPAKRDEYIRNLRKGDVLDAALQSRVREMVSGVERRQRDELAVRRTELAELYNQWAATHRGFGVEYFFGQRPNGQAELQTLGLEMINSLNRQSEAGRDDMAVYGRFHDEAVSNPKKFAEMPYDEWYTRYGRHLSEHRNAAQSLYESLRRPTGSAAAAAGAGGGAGFLPREQIVANAGARFALTAKAPESVKDEAKKLAYARRYARFVDEVQRRATDESEKTYRGKDVPDNVLSQIAARVAAEQIRIDLDESIASSGFGPRIEQQMQDEEDEVFFGMEALNAMTDEQQLRAYLPLQNARQLTLEAGGPNLEAIARQMIRDYAAAQGTVADPSDWRVSRVAMALLTNNASYINAVIRQRY